MLSPSFLAASQIMSETVSRLAFCIGLLSMMSAPIRVSCCIFTASALLSHEIFSQVCAGKFFQLTGAERNTLPFRPCPELDDEVEERLSDAMASHSFAAMLSLVSMKIVLPFDILKLPAWSVAWAMRSG